MNDSQAPAAADSLEAALARLRPGLDLLSLPACVLDRDGLYRYANAAYLAYTGKAAGELLGRTAADAFGVQPRDDRRKALARVFGGESLTSDRETIEGPFKGHSVRAHYFPLWLEGTGAAACVALVDIQHLKDAQDTLAERARQL
jgi:PAS domain-containing protein